MYSSITPNNFCTLPQFLDSTHQMFITICSLLYNSKFMIIDLAKKPEGLESFFCSHPSTCQKRVCFFTQSLVVSASIKDGCCQEWIHVTTLTMKLNLRLFKCCDSHSLQQWCRNECLQTQSPRLLRVVEMWVVRKKSTLIFSRVCEPVPVERRGANHGHHRECRQTTKIFDVVGHDSHAQHHEFCETRK